MKKLILLIWVMLILSLLAFSAFADTVQPPEDAKCKMYYDKEGVAYIPASCIGNCNHLPKVGDKYVDEDGNVTAVVTDIIVDYTIDGKIQGYFVGSEGDLPSRK